MAPRIAVVDYGIGNLRSAQKALEHAGARASLTADPAEIGRAAGVVLPGVGAFGACMAALEATGCADATRAAARDGRPFLGICVGMQMLFEGSDESPGVPGLGVLRGRVVHLPSAGLPLPQMGWNTLDIATGSRLCRGLPDPAWVYFVHTYAVLEAPDAGPAARVTWADYGTRFVAALELGPCWATQFHPEKSSAVGLAVLHNFVEACGP
jgi:glutamine amidotransferase